MLRCGYDAQYPLIKPPYCEPQRCKPPIFLAYHSARYKRLVKISLVLHRHRHRQPPRIKYYPQAHRSAGAEADADPCKCDKYLYLFICFIFGANRCCDENYLPGVRGKKRFAYRRLRNNVVGRKERKVKQDVANSVISNLLEKEKEKRKKFSTAQEKVLARPVGRQGQHEQGCAEGRT